MKKVVIYQHESGVAAVVTPTLEALKRMTIEQIAAKDVPDGVSFEIIESASLPSDRLFRSAWRFNGVGIVEDLEASRSIAHDKRREKRTEEFVLHDEVISLDLPGKDKTEAEAERAQIRNKYDRIQADIDTVSDTEGLREILKVEGIVSTVGV